MNDFSSSSVDTVFRPLSATTHTMMMHMREMRPPYPVMLQGERVGRLDRAAKGGCEVVQQGRAGWAGGHNDASRAKPHGQSR